MESILNKLKSILNSTIKNNVSEQKDADCNYSNNYYGDQYCQPRSIKITF
ncbi:hypothetical protein SAMN02745724_02425 [Pseudoalteromonas denitrificans DSM 6059]|uniref:Uncharacterized protein n=1 Tax=Pseudoalteromonas denitrificans DSM 6059 TaxID=1123010 RepID=A0A1I1LMY2_9GAMM|nr:hypothetical protein SAMN02745724_02425 [Pseudoalteromonas denitrificans DSM 6059]